MPLEREEYLWRMVNEHMTQARHQETLRTSVATLIITLSGAIIAFVTIDKVVTIGDTPILMLYLLLGIFGIIVTAKHYERFNHHIARVRFYREPLEASFPAGDCKQIRDAAKSYHEINFPHLSKKPRQHELWLLLHALNTAIALVLIFMSFA